MELECQNYCAMMCGFCVVVFSIDFTVLYSHVIQSKYHTIGVSQNTIVIRWDLAFSNYLNIYFKLHVDLHFHHLIYIYIYIIMYIYHALINPLSAHMIHINLNMIFYTHVKHSPTKTIYIKYYLKKKKRTTNTLYNMSFRVDGCSGISL